MSISLSLSRFYIQEPYLVSSVSHHLLPLFPSKCTFRNFLFCVPGMVWTWQCCYCHSSFSRFLPFPSSSLAQGFCLFLAKGGVKRGRTLLCTLETARMFPLEFLFPPVVGLLWPPFSSTVTVAFSTCKALYVLAVWTHITFTLVYRGWWTVSFHRWERKNPGLYKQKMSGLPGSQQEGSLYPWNYLLLVVWVHCSFL